MDDSYPIPDLCKAHTISLLTGASHVGKRRFAMGLVASLLDGHAPGNRVPNIPTIGWLTITNGKPAHTLRKLQNAFHTAQLKSVWDSPRFSAQAISISELSGHNEPDSPACTLTAELIANTFAGAYGTDRLARGASLAIPRFIILDSIHHLMRDDSPNSPSLVTRMMEGLESNLADANSTMLALALMTKLKAGDRFKRVPDLIHGSGAWGEHAHSVWQVDIEDDDTARLQKSLAARHTLSIATDEGDLEKYVLEPDSRGLLITSSLDQLVHASLQDKIAAWFDSLASGAEITTADILAKFDDNGGSGKTAERWITEQRKLGRLQPIRKGLHRVQPVC